MPERQHCIADCIDEYRPVLPQRRQAAGDHGLGHRFPQRPEQQCFAIYEQDGRRTIGGAIFVSADQGFVLPERRFILRTKCFAGRGDEQHVSMDFVGNPEQFTLWLITHSATGQNQALDGTFVEFSSE